MLTVYSYSFRISIFVGVVDQSTYDLRATYGNRNSGKWSTLRIVTAPIECVWSTSISIPTKSNPPWDVFRTIHGAVRTARFFKGAARRVTWNSPNK